MPEHVTLLAPSKDVYMLPPSIQEAAGGGGGGDLSKIIVRRVGGADGGFVVQRFNELFAAKGFVGYLTWMRCDGLLSNAGTGPVKSLQMHA